ncbi:MAG TPA: GHMP kinase [Candidatus Angelobacter sp.]
MLIARSPFRVSFGGGGTDLPAYFEAYGGAVLSAAIDKYFYTIVGKRADGHIQIISSDLRVSQTWNDIRQMSVKESGGPLEIPLAVLKDLDCEVAVDLFLASEVPPGTGLGSSASVCVNVLQAMATFLQRPLSKYDLAEKAFSIATDVLGKPVGKQDEFAAAFGGLNFMTFERDGSSRVEPIRLKTEVLSALQQKLMLFFTGSARDSWSILKDQEESSRKRQGAAVEALHEIRELAYRMRLALEQDHLEQFGLLLHEGWENKKKISSRISNPAIDRMYTVARNMGAAGGKITGAGGGGFMLLYCDEERQPAVRQAFAAESIHEMRFGFDFGGSKVLVNDPFVDREETCAPPWTFVTAAKQQLAGRKAPG